MSNFPDRWSYSANVLGTAGGTVCAITVPAGGSLIRHVLTKLIMEVSDFTGGAVPNGWTVTVSDVNSGAVLFSWSIVTFSEAGNRSDQEGFNGDLLSMGTAGSALSVSIAPAAGPLVRQRLFLEGYDT